MIHPPEKRPHGVRGYPERCGGTFLTCRFFGLFYIRHVENVPPQGFPDSLLLRNLNSVDHLIRTSSKLLGQSDIVQPLHLVLPFLEPPAQKINQHLVFRRRLFDVNNGPRCPGKGQPSDPSKGPRTSIPCLLALWLDLWIGALYRHSPASSPRYPGRCLLPEPSSMLSRLVWMPPWSHKGCAARTELTLRYVILPYGNNRQGKYAQSNSFVP